MAAKFIKLFLYVQKSNLKTAFLNLSDALVNVLMMMLNNFSYIFMWWILFQNKGSINGWNFGDMALLFAVANISFATYALFMRGLETLPEYIDSGGLDNFLVMPRSELMLIAFSESSFANWGDYLTGFIMYFFSGHIGWTSFGLLILVTILASVLLFAIRLLASSLAFFINDSQRLGDNFFIAVITFASQPSSIYTGWYKVISLTIVPAGFLVYYPVEVIRAFSWTNLLCLLGGVAIFLALSLLVWRQGLKHYSSGNRFGVR